MNSIYLSYRNAKVILLGVESRCRCIEIQNDLKVIGTCLGLLPLCGTVARYGCGDVSQIQLHLMSCNLCLKTCSRDLCYR